MYNDQILVREVLPECFFLTDQGSLPTEDRLTESLRQFFTANRLTLSNIAAMQLFLDIFHTMGDSASRGFNELKGVATTINDNINSLNLLSYPNEWDTTFSSCRRKLDRLSDFIDEAVETDVVLDTCYEYLGDEYGHPYVVEEHERPFLLYKRHPLLCGLL